MFERVGGVVCLVCSAILGAWILLLWIGAAMKELENRCFRFMSKFEDELLTEKECEEGGE